MALGTLFNVIASLCYGKHNTADLRELCGGTAGISKAAFRRGLSFGGYLGLVTGCDRGHPEVQSAVIHYLDTCYMLVVIVQPNCRSVGKFANYNSVMHYDTAKEHREEDLPQIRFGGKAAEREHMHGLVTARTNSRYLDRRDRPLG